MIDVIKNTIKKVVRRVASKLPGSLLRCKLYRLGGVEIGKNTYIARDVIIGNKVNIGNNVWIDRAVVIAQLVEIGDGVKINSKTTITEGIKLERNVTVGSNALLANAIVGENSFIEYGVIFTGFGKKQIKIGKHCYIGIYAVLDRSGGLDIGDYVHIAGPSTGIWTHTSMYECLLGDKSGNRTHTKIAQVKIENNVWIGGNSTIYPDIRIDSHSVVLPNSAVNKDVPSYSMVGGVPIEVKRKIKVGEVISFVVDNKK